MKKILLPTDFSINSENAIAYATQLFKKEPCRFYLLHAYRNIPSAPTNKKSAEQEVEALARRCAANSDHKHHRFEGLVLTDSVVSAIDATFMDKGIDYVVMGTQGSTALKEVLLGSNTANAIKHLARCPLIVVPTGLTFKTPKAMAFATDYKHRFMEAEMRPLLQLALLWKATVQVVHVEAEPELAPEQLANRSLLERTLGNVAHALRTVPKKDSLANTLLSLEQSEGHPDMVAMLRTQHGFFGSMFREPVLKKMAFKTQIPLLVMPLF
ncbi:universal stress protein [Maribacter sp. 2307ULW6-5]|uniref:universal stress protein n=1 Tax=Maribacter sp. 2307ULW6-5 TaxID=3386275 RepID=UPI0039BC7E76